MSKQVTQVYKQHDLSAAFPKMEQEEFEKLVDDIRANGQVEPGILHEGKIIDGWHRYRACTILGMPFEVRPMMKVDPVQFVLSKNLTRRHLSKQQRAIAVTRCAGWRSKGRVKEEDQKDTMTEQELANLSKTSVSTVQAAKRAIRRGEADDVMAGKKKIYDKKKMIEPAMPPALKKAYDDIEKLKARLRDSNEREANLMDKLEAYMDVTEGQSEDVQKRAGEMAEIRALRQSDNQQKTRIQHLLAENQKLLAENNLLKQKLKV